MVSKTFKEALVDFWDALIPLVGLNILWFLLTALVIPAFPALGGLYYVTNRVAHGEMADTRTFFEGFKSHFWTSYKWGFLNLIAYFLLTLNIWFYGQFEGFGYVILQSIFFSATVIYTCIQIYTYPFLLEQEVPSIKTALRNGFAAFVHFMGRSFLMLLFILVIAVISTLFPPLWILVTMGLIVYFGNWQTLVSIQKLRQIESETETDIDLM
jgi:uncharacterized membrane protein YesL